MKREFAKPIAEVLGVLVTLAFFLAAWFFELQLRKWPEWVLFALVIGSAALLVYTAIRLSKRLQ